ncbi:MAG: N-formylglutamate deformylase [Dokdonella sp.]|uniref:N-formylglutamate deformylase n=1 Tax=Dokdonella sp. TaxID=2291710 RepID=UPI003267FCFD
MDLFTLHRGTAPLLISLPHEGTLIPDDIAARMTPAARRVPDTDWNVERLYAFARDLGASMIVPAYSRYVVDLNRPSDNASLYPGQNTTGLCPIVQFSGEPIYQVGEEPHGTEIADRVAAYWTPYHDALAGEIDRLRRAHGRVVLWEGHSIRSVVPFLFDGRLPDFNLGTADGASCSKALATRLVDVLAAQTRFTHVANGRFKGGYITRQFGRPADGVEAIQLELTQLNYMDEETFEFMPARAAATQVVIRRLLEECL